MQNTERQGYTIIENVVQLEYLICVLTDDLQIYGCDREGLHRRESIIETIDQIDGDDVVTISFENVLNS